MRVDVVVEETGQRHVTLRRDNMLNYYVIWRGDEDEFFITLLQYENTPEQLEAINGWSNQMWVSQAFDAEYPSEPNPFLGENAASYEMIDIFSGENIKFHMK